jgi:hypothetical protein
MQLGYLARQEPGLVSGKWQRVAEERGQKTAPVADIRAVPMFRNISFFSEKYVGAPRLELGTSALSGLVNYNESIGTYRKNFF